MERNARTNKNLDLPAIADLSVGVIVVVVGKDFSRRIVV
jgi:hypothetical protein